MHSYSKSRLAPLKSTFISRLERSAATVSIRLEKMLKREIEIPLSEPSIFWTEACPFYATLKVKTSVFTYLLRTALLLTTFINGGAFCYSIVFMFIRPTRLTLV